MLQPTKNNNTNNQNKKPKASKKGLVKKIVPLVVALIIVLIAIFGVSRDNKEDETSDTTQGSSAVTTEPIASSPELVISTPGVGYEEVSIPQESAFEMNGSTLIFGEDIMFSGASPQADSTGILLDEYCKVKPVNECTYRFSNNQIDVKHSSGAIFSLKRAVAPKNVQEGYEELDENGKPIGSIADNMDAHLTDILAKGGAENIKLGILFGGTNGRTAVGDVLVGQTEYTMRVAACTCENELYLMTCLYNDKSAAFVNYLFGAVQIGETAISFS